MDKATYATMPKSLTLREVRTQIREPGFRVGELVVVTTLTDTQGYPKDAILDLFHDRWHVELDLRAINRFNWCPNDRARDRPGGVNGYGGARCR